MAKMTYRKIKEAEGSLAMIRNGVLWEPEFALRLKKAIASAWQHLDDYNEESIKIIKGFGGKEVRTQMGNRWQIAPAELPENATKEQSQKIDDEYHANVKKADAKIKELKAQEVDVKTNKLPAGDFKKNFIVFLNPELKGQKFGWAIDDLEALEFLLNVGK